MTVAPSSLSGMLRRGLFAWAALCGSLFAAAPARAQSGDNVAVVINENSPDSVRVGDYYAKARTIPAANILRIRTSTDEAVDRATYTRTIEQPLAALLARERLQDRVLYLVLTRGVPLRINGSEGLDGLTASVDSELTLLYRRMTGQPVAVNASVPNPYFLGDKGVSEAKPFTHQDHDIYLVTRLDGFTVNDAIALVDRATAARAAHGRVVLDQRDALVDRTPETWLAEAAQRLKADGHGDEVILETTAKAARDISPVLGYFSWGSTDPQNRLRRSGMGFIPGAIAANFVGSDARTFRPPPDTWIPDPTNRTYTYAGSGESLIGDLIQDGVTAVAGNVAQPFLVGTIRPQILFPAYFAGFNVAEAFYLATPRVSWQQVVIGDPLAAPFRRRTLTRDDIDKGIDAATELPSLFARRRLAVAQAQSRGVPEAALTLALRGEARLGRGDLRGARTAYEQAAEAAPRYAAPLTQLAILDEQARQFDAAVVRYRKILEFQPNSVIALNNLAYALAVRKNEPAEGLRFAQRAASLAPKDPSVLDTLGWIQHLTGDEQGAAKVMAAAARLAPDDADIRMHAATVFAAAGMRGSAEAELKEAIRLNPSLDKSPEATAVRSRLQSPAPR